MTKNLSETWFIEGNIDFESKKYTLLAYLKQVMACFDDNHLYPELSDLIFHYNNLATFKENKQLIQKMFPRKLTGIQMQKLKLIYEAMVADDELMEEIESIVQYAILELKNTIHTGTDLYEFIESSMSISPVGIIPLDQDKGFFFLNTGHYRDIHVYQYQLSIFEKSESRYRSLRTQYIDSWERNFSNSYESIKNTLVRENRSLPAPAVYAIESPLNVPIDSTLLPIAKRSLVKHIATQ